MFGFLGPNGSGKTTTIRCLLGLARPDRGQCRVLGADASARLPEVDRKGGRTRGGAGRQPGLSGRQTLDGPGDDGRHRPPRASTPTSSGSASPSGRTTPCAATRSACGSASASRIALLKDPELLILDEPANGLDPAGIREVRELIRRLGAEGRTVFLSSHLLGEVEQVCDEVAIVAHGRTVAQGSVADVLASTRPSAMWVKVTDLAAGAATLGQAGLLAVPDGDRIRVEIDAGEAEHVTRALVADGHYPTELRPVETSLEDAFFALTDELGGAQLMTRLLAAELRGSRPGASSG